MGGVKELFLKKVHVAVDVSSGELVYHHLWCQLVESLVLQFTRGRPAKERDVYGEEGSSRKRSEQKKYETVRSEQQGRRPSKMEWAGEGQARVRAERKVEEAISGLQRQVSSNTGAGYQMGKLSACSCLRLVLMQLRLIRGM